MCMQNTFKPVMEIKCKNQDGNQSRILVKAVSGSEINWALPPESLGRTSTLQASLVVSEIVEP